MNHIVANIYGTGGLEKTASAEEGLPETLYDLALMIAVDKTGGDDLEKTASVHDNYFSDLLSFDRAGRALAHQEFYELEKAAAEGDTSGLEQFFADHIDQEETNELSDMKEAILAELASRIED